jgi:superfamily II DNA/RNA helicase
VTDSTKTFADFGVHTDICETLAEAGITSPFPIQELTLPLALGGADLIGQARTGTGKTLAFGIPLLQRIDPGAGYTQALVVVPTRELCVQVREDLARASARLGFDVVALYGGKAIEPQAKAVEDGAAVVVGTPGRLLDLMRRGSLKLGKVSMLVLDEADEMLDLGFLPDVEQLVQATAAERQTLLFSATMPSAVVALARRYMHKPTFLRADVEEVHVAPLTKQHFFSCHRMDKPAVVARILQAPNRGLCVVFTRTKRMADVLAEELRERGVKAAPIHSDLRQEAREKALERFRKGTITVLVATEVAARGLDIDDVTHVVNYDCPEDEKMYLHRIGRTGRAGAAGVAVTLVLWNELARLEMIKRTLDISEPTHEVFSTSPILDELFDLPARDAGRKAVPVSDDDEDEAPVASARSAAKPRAAQPRAAQGDGERDGEARKPRRRGGRGRGPRSAEGETTATETRQEPAAREPRAPRAESAATDAAPAPRVADGDVEPRRRTRQRVVRGPNEATETAEVTAAEPRPAREPRAPRTEAPARAETKLADDSDGGQVRRRTRTRTGGTAVTAAEAAAAAREPREGREPREAREPRAERPRSGEGRSGGGRSGERSGERAGERRTDGRSEGRGGEPRARRDDGQSRTRDERGGARTTSTRGGRNGESRGGRTSERDAARTGRSRSGRDRDRDRTPRERSEPVEVEVARDGARPVITRPLKIQHLP